jgi:hypothetical protein
MQETERVAISARIIEEARGEYFLVIGSGDHHADRWRISADTLRSLSIDSFNLAIKLP